VLTLLALPAHAQVDPNRFVDAFESSFGKHEGFRRSGANPNAPDNGKTQRNLALLFKLPDGEIWQMGNISAPIFGAATPEQFIGRFESLRPDPATKMPDAAKAKALADANPEVLLQGRDLAGQPVPASFGGVNYWGVHSFGFVNARGAKQWGKWVFEPVGGTQGLTDDEAKAKGPSFLFAELRERLGRGVVHDQAQARSATHGYSRSRGQTGRKAGTQSLRPTARQCHGSGVASAAGFMPARMCHPLRVDHAHADRSGPRLCNYRNAT
jgi:hypothetical protein